MNDLNKYIIEAKDWDGVFNYMDAMVLAQFAYLPFGADLDGYTGSCINVSGITIGEFSNLLLNERYASILEFRFGKESDSYNDFLGFCTGLSINKRDSKLHIFSFSYENEP